MSNDDVLELLDSLDKDTELRKSRKKEPRSTKKSNNSNGEDILGILDNLEVSKGATSKYSKSTKQRSKVPEENRRETPDIHDAPKPDASTSSRLPGEAADNAASVPTQQEETAMPDSTGEMDVDGLEISDIANGITSWWSKNKGGIWESASRAANLARDRASVAVKDIREEQPFTLGAIGNRLTSVLNTIVPPIGHHERLNINIFHDMVGYSNIDQLLHEVFEQVMDQVEGGGDLNLVVHKGKERQRVGSEWNTRRSLNYAKCSLDSSVKLARASIEEYRESRLSEKDESSPADPAIRVSELYVSIQPVLSPQADAPASNKETQITIDSSSLYFAVYLADFEHNIKLVTISQAFPSEWADWLDGDESRFAEAKIDPRQWVSGWVEDGLSLAFGTLAQKYVTIRMGITPLPNES